MSVGGVRDCFGSAGAWGKGPFAGLLTEAELGKRGFSCGEGARGPWSGPSAFSVGGL